MMMAEGSRFAPVLALQEPVSPFMTPNARMASPMRMLPERASATSLVKLGGSNQTPAHFGSHQQYAVTGWPFSQQELQPRMVPPKWSVEAPRAAQVLSRGGQLQAYQDKQEEIYVECSSAGMRSMQEAHTTQICMLESRMLHIERALSSSNIHENVLEAERQERKNELGELTAFVQGIRQEIFTTVNAALDECDARVRGWMTDLRAAVQQLSQKHSAVHESAYMVEGDHLKAEMEKMAAAMEGTTTFVQQKCGSFEQELVVLETELHETCDRF